MLATASIDKTVRVWDTLHVSEENSPKLIAYKSMNVGRLFTLQFCADEPYLLATAGDQGVLAVWESSEVEQIKDNFDGRINQSSEHVIQEFVIGCNDELMGDKPVEDTSWMDSVENGDNGRGDKMKKKKKKSRRP